MRTKIKDICWFAPLAKDLRCRTHDSMWFVCYLSNKTKRKSIGNFGQVYKYFKTRAEMRKFLKRLRKKEVS